MYLTVVQDEDVFEGEPCRGFRSGKPHHRQLLPVDGRLGRERGHRLADRDQPARQGSTPRPARILARWLAAQQPGTATPAFRAQFDTTAVLPFYAYLAATGAFLQNHCSGFGTNSTPNHLLIVGGQSPTLRNPPRSAPQPEWDMPSLPGHAQPRPDLDLLHRHIRLPRRVLHPTQRPSPTSSATTASAPTPRICPALSIVWHDSPYDEHPVADITLGHNQIWTDVAAVAAAGHWDDTVFLLTWDDWGGYDDHVVTPNVEHTPDGVQLAYGPRVPLLIFGGPVTPGIDTRWNSHVSIPKTVLELLACRRWAYRVDDAPSLADLVDSSVSNPPPPAFGTAIADPLPRLPPRHPHRRPRTLSRSARLCSGRHRPLHHPTTNPSPPPNTLSATERPTCRDGRGRPHQ